MNENNKLIIENILYQAKVFLVELGEFAPFGCALTYKKEIKPLGVFLDEDNPSSLRIIEMLEGHLNKILVSSDYLAGAIGIDVKIKNDKESFDGIEIRVFDKDRQFIIRFRYKVKSGDVEFDALPSS